MTNSNLIPVFNGLIQNQPVQLCNARELHTFLEIQTRYNDWIKNRITSDFNIDPMTNWRVLKHLRGFNPKAVKIDF